MGEKKYLKWYNKLGYGLGELSGSATYALFSCFGTLYLADYAGLNTAIVGSLMAAAKIFDGVTDVLFGSLLDRTHSKMGKARPWMLYAQIGCVICYIAMFAIPESWGETAKYAYFFVIYIFSGAIFGTARGIAYSTLLALITKNQSERVQCSTISTIFSFAIYLIIGSIGMGLITSIGWRNTAMVVGLAALIINTLAVLSVKELPEDEGIVGHLDDTPKEEKGNLSLLATMKLLVTNKFFLLALGINILVYFTTGSSGITVFYTNYVLCDSSIYGAFNTVATVPIMLGVLIVPFTVKKLGIYKTNLYFLTIASIFSALAVVGGTIHSIPLTLFSIAAKNVFWCCLSATMTALTGEIADYSLRKTGHNVTGAMFSTTSMGLKVGSALASFVNGILLDIGGYVPNQAIQPQSSITAITFGFLWIPLLINIGITIMLYFLKVEKANKEWDMAHGVQKESV